MDIPGYNGPYLCNEDETIPGDGNFLTAKKRRCMSHSSITGNEIVGDLRDYLSHLPAIYLESPSRLDLVSSLTSVGAKTILLILVSEVGRITWLGLPWCSQIRSQPRPH